MRWYSEFIPANALDIVPKTTNLWQILQEVQIENEKLEKYFANLYPASKKVTIQKNSKRSKNKFPLAYIEREQLIMPTKKEKYGEPV